MGGLHSGRPKTHSNMDDCLEIDMMWMKKQKMLQGSSHSFTLQWKRWREIDFHKRTEQTYTAGALLSHKDGNKTLTLTYQAGQNSKLQIHDYTINLTSTPCNYGGLRWWLVAPCCGRTTRTLFINLRANAADMKPQCRHCLDLHYPSQCASYIEKHITYEKHLLSNYGYYWAADRYNFMKEHYFKVTDEYWFKAERSQLIRHLEIMRLLIRGERVILKHRMECLKSLDPQGRRDLFADMAADPKRAEDLQEYQHLEAIMVARGIIPAANESGDQADPSQQSEESNIMGLQLARWIVEEEQFEEALQELDKAA